MCQMYPNIVPPKCKHLARISDSRAKVEKSETTGLLQYTYRKQHRNLKQFTCPLVPLSPWIPFSPFCPGDPVTLTVPFCIEARGHCKTILASLKLQLTQNFDIPFSIYR